MAKYITIDQAVETVTKIQGLRGDTLYALNKLPTIDIVHCGECRRWERKEDTKYGFCHACQYGYLSNRWDIGIYRKTEEDHYCADGERKGE